MYTTCALTLLDGDMWLECVAEGSDGCLVSALWTAMRIQNDENMQRFVWRAICSQKVGSRVRVVTCWPDFRVLLEDFNLFFHSRDFHGNPPRDTLCGVSAWSEHPPTRLLMRDVILKNMTFRVMLLVFFQGYIFMMNDPSLTSGDKDMPPGKVWWMDGRVATMGRGAASTSESDSWGVRSWVGFPCSC